MPSANEDAAGYLNDVYNTLQQKRVSLLIELDDIRRQMDDILLAIRRIEDNEPEATE